VKSLRELFASLARPALGAWIKLPGAESCEILAQSGFDFLVIDLEHSQLSLDAAFRLITTTSLAGLPAVVRLPELDRVSYQKLLDSGASGILAPQLDTVADVELGLSFSRYPPLGLRGFSTTTRAGKWGIRSMAEHVRRSNEEITFIPQLESRAALENVEDIVSIDGLDAIFVGRADLSVSMGVSGESPILGRLVSDAIAVCQSRQVLVGTAVSDLVGANARAGDGFDFIVVGDDASMLATSARGTAQEMRSAFATRGGPDVTQQTLSAGDHLGGQA